PEVQAQDVAFPGEQVIVDVQPGHRAQVTADDPIGDEGRDIGAGVAAVLDVVQHAPPHLETCLVARIPFGDPGIQVPAVVVERRLGRLGQALHRCEIPALEFGQAHDHVGNLHTRVVDVVLHFHGTALEAQEAYERVAKGGVPQVTDVSGLVRIDGRVLDD